MSSFAPPNPNPSWRTHKTPDNNRRRYWRVHRPNWVLGTSPTQNPPSDTNTHDHAQRQNVRCHQRPSPPTRLRRRRKSGNPEICVAFAAKAKSTAQSIQDAVCISALSRRCSRWCVGVFNARKSARKRKCLLGKICYVPGHWWHITRYCAPDMREFIELNASGENS